MARLVCFLFLFALATSTPVADPTTTTSSSVSGLATPPASSKSNLSPPPVPTCLATHNDAVLTCDRCNAATGAKICRRCTLGHCTLDIPGVPCAAEIMCHCNTRSVTECILVNGEPWDPSLSSGG